MIAWSKEKLDKICRPKQWPTIPTSAMVRDGYPVYGANGKIGYYTEYTHEKPTLLITCRGATCGTLNISEPFSYVTGNAMALDELDEDRVDQKFLFYALNHRGLKDVISGSAQPQITRQSLSPVEIPLPPLDEQRRIAAILDKADAICRKRQESIRLAEEFLCSTFLEMFGDPVTNPKGWDMVPIKELGDVTTGNTPSRDCPEYYGNGIEWIKSDNLNTPYHFLTEAKEQLTLAGQKVGRIVPENSTLVTCIAGSPECIGNAAIANRPVAFNQQINAVTPFKGTDPYFLYTQILVAKKLIQSQSTESMKGMVSKGKFENISFLKPPTKLQEEFGKIFTQLHSMIQKTNLSCEYSSNIYNSLVQQAFSGGLT